jgi:hypothetical protein
MLSVVLDKVNHIVVFETDGPLSERDFCAADAQVNSIVDQDGKLNGIVVRAKSFPGWESIAALISHLRFVKNHREIIPRVALVTASMAAHFEEIFSTHFVPAEIRVFSYHDIKKANRWVSGKFKN